MSHHSSPESFTGKTTEEIQAHFEEQRLNGSVPEAKKWSRRIKPVDIDQQFQRILTVVEREITKLMDVSHSMEPLTEKDHEALVAYAKLVSSLKKQMSEALANMNPEDVEKIADED